MGLIDWGLTPLLTISQLYHGSQLTYSCISWFSHTSTPHNNLPKQRYFGNIIKKINFVAMLTYFRGTGTVPKSFFTFFVRSCVDVYESKVHRIVLFCLFWFLSSSRWNVSSLNKIFDHVCHTASNNIEYLQTCFHLPISLCNISDNRDKWFLTINPLNLCKHYHYPLCTDGEGLQQNVFFLIKWAFWTCK